MRSAGRMLAFTGGLFAALAQAPVAQAESFGQQWRPTVDYPTVSVRPVQRRVAYRSANVPSFRPRTEPVGGASRLASAPRYAEARQPALVQAPTGYAVPRYQPIAGYPSIGAYQRIPTYASPQYPAPVSGGMPLWANPMTQMARVWQNPMPTFAPQFAWQHTEQPYRGHAAVPTYGARPYNLQPRFGYVPTHFGAVPGAQPYAGDRRPTPRVQSRQRYSASPRTIASYQSTANAMRAAVPRGGWRPDRAATTHSPSLAFRPAGYGRSSRTDSVTRSRVAGNSLPGWATTFQDRGDSFSCHWCSKS